MLWITGVLATQEEPVGRLFVILNTAVHTIMYAYFGLMVRNVTSQKRILF